MRILARIGLTVVLVLLGIGHAVAQTATLSGDLLADWRQQKRTMMGIAEAMPEEAFSFKPTDAQRTYAEQILHIAGANVYLMQHLGGAAAAADVDTTDFTVFGLSATSKAGVLEALGAGYDYGIAVLQEFSDGRPLKILTVIEEYSRECLAIVVARRRRSLEVLETLAELFVTYGVPVHLRSACYEQVEQVVKALGAVGPSNRGTDTGSGSVEPAHRASSGLIPEERRVPGGSTSSCLRREGLRTTVGMASSPVGAGASGFYAAIDSSLHTWSASNAVRFLTTANA